MNPVSYLVVKSGGHFHWENAKPERGRFVGRMVDTDLETLERAIRSIPPQTESVVFMLRYLEFLDGKSSVIYSVTLSTDPIVAVKVTQDNLVSTVLDFVKDER